MDRVFTPKSPSQLRRREKAWSRKDAKELESNPQTVEEMMLCHGQKDTWNDLYLGSF